MSLEADGGFGQRLRLHPADGVLFVISFFKRGLRDGCFVKSVTVQHEVAFLLLNDQQTYFLLRLKRASDDIHCVRYSERANNKGRCILKSKRQSAARIILVCFL